MKLTKAQTKKALELLKTVAPYSLEVDNFFKELAERPEKRSTTHKERVFYIGTTTFFFRHYAAPPIEAIFNADLVAPKEGWYWAKATLDSRDHFSRDRGRTAARRNFFACLNKYFGFEAPKYEDVEKLLNV